MFPCEKSVCDFYLFCFTLFIINCVIYIDNWKIFLNSSCCCFLKKFFFWFESSSSINRLPDCPSFFHVSLKIVDMVGLEKCVQICFRCWSVLFISTISKNDGDVVWLQFCCCYQSIFLKIYLSTLTDAIIVYIYATGFMFVSLYLKATKINRWNKKKNLTWNFLSNPSNRKNSKLFPVFVVIIDVFSVCLNVVCVCLWCLW